MITPIAKAEINKNSESNEPIIGLMINKSTSESSLKNIKVVDENTNEEIFNAVESAKNKISGMVSWYSDKFHGLKTSSGELYNKQELTAAHKTLPFGTKVKVTNVKNGKSVVVKINDRGPHSKSRVLDLSKAAFNEIGSINSGVLNVEMEVVK